MPCGWKLVALNQLYSNAGNFPSPWRLLNCIYQPKIPFPYLLLTLYQRTELTKHMQGSELKLCLEAPHVHRTLLRQPEDTSKVRSKGKTVSALEGGSSCSKFYLSSLWKKAVQAVEVLFPVTHMVLTLLPYLLTYLPTYLSSYLLIFMHITNGNHWLFWRKPLRQYFHSLFWRESDYPC